MLSSVAVPTSNSRHSPLGTACNRQALGAAMKTLQSITGRQVKGLQLSFDLFTNALKGKFHAITGHEGPEGE
jgi:hypothetical protein